ncbi:MAG TPA: signal recognition particle receptor subunit alpha, partial [Bacillota bacterium]|nr:signal recognition particle receptor subunit alpha [Bacillota bacterium]
MMEKKKGIFAKMKEGLAKTRSGITERIDELIKYYKEIDDDFFDDLEEALIISDMGFETSHAIINDLKGRVKAEKLGNADEIKKILKEDIAKILEKDTKSIDLPPPTVVLVVGVNGVGKTTTIGKLANILRKDGKSVLVAAADTFRAAAAE